MATTVPAHIKTVSFKAPYTGSTFQRFANYLFGRDGYLAGGEVSDDGSTITLDSTVTFVRSGLVVETDAGSVSLGVVPTAAEPWFVVASAADDNPDTGASLSVTTDPAAAQNGVVIAFKANGKWQNPAAVDIQASAERATPVGLEVGGGVGLGTVTGGDVHTVKAFQGQVVDADGVHRDLPGTLDITLMRPSPDAMRTDHVVLRQLDRTAAEVVYLMGSTISTSASEVIAATGGTVKRPISCAVRGGTTAQQWLAWGEGNALKFLPNGGSTTTVAGAATVHAEWAGVRANGDVVVLFQEGNALKLVSFAQAGTVVDAATTVANTGATISHVSAALDRNNLLHIVFENDEATQQVYYMRCRIDTFAAIDIAPKYVLGSATGQDDVWPSVGVDRLGQVTIAMIRGASSTDHGSLVMASLSSTGILLDSTELDPATDVGVTVDAASTDAPVATVFTNFRRTAVVVTPHDEVYVFTLGLADGDSDVLHLLAHSPEYAGRSGFALLSVSGSFALDSNWTTGSLDAIAAAAGEQGEVFVVLKVNQGGTSRFWQMTFNTPLLPTGKDYIRSSYLGSQPFDNGADSSGSKTIHIARGRTGDMVVGYLLATDGKSAARAPLGYMAPRHPRDIYLGSWAVPKASTAYAAETDNALELFNVRPRSLAYPFLVGSNGNFQGANALSDAALRAYLMGGGEVIVRSGNHPVPLQVVLSRGVTLRGESRAVLTVNNASGAIAGGSGIATTVTCSGNIMSGGRALNELAPGDVVELDTSGFHVVRRLLPYDGTNYRVLLEDNGYTGSVVTPAGTTATFYTSGIRIENLTFLLPVNHASTVFLGNCYQPELRGLAFELGDTVSNGYIHLDGCKGAVVDHIDLTRVGPGSVSNKLMVLKNGKDALVRNVQMSGDRGKIVVETSEVSPMFVNCRAPGSQIAYEIQATRTTPAYFSSCTGVIDGEATTWVNTQMVVDNTTGDSALTMARWQGHASQTAPMVEFEGVWPDAGSQTIVDGTGRVRHRGDHFFEDFHQFPSSWDIKVSGSAFSDPVLVKERTDHLAPHFVYSSGWTQSADITNLGPIASTSLTAGQTAKGTINLDVCNNRRLTRVALAAYASDAITGSTTTLEVWSYPKSIGTPQISVTPTLLASLAFAPGTTGYADGELDVLGTVGDVTAGEDSGLVLVVKHDFGPGGGLGSNVFIRNLRVTTDLGNSTYATLPLESPPIYSGSQGNAVYMAIATPTGADSTGELTTRSNVGAWAKQPLVRMRVKIGDVTDVALLHTFGMLVGNGLGPGVFAHDPGDFFSLGASNQMRVIIMNDSNAMTSVLTGFTPTAGQYYWFWLGWKSETEVYWGISDDLESAFIASGSLAVGSGVVKTADFRLAALVQNVDPSVGAPDASLVVDAIEYSSATKFMS